jgi:hypothetical protein
MKDRHILHTIHTDDGALEIYWTRADDDFPELLPGFEGYNSLLLHQDGAVTWKGWTDAEVPVVVTIRANHVTVAISEDQPADDAQTVVFDSAKLTTDDWDELLEPPTNPGEDRAGLADQC